MMVAMKTLILTLAAIALGACAVLTNAAQDQAKQLAAEELKNDGGGLGLLSKAEDGGTTLLGVPVTITENGKKR